MARSLASLPQRLTSLFHRLLIAQDLRFRLGSKAADDEGALSAGRLLAFHLDQAGPAEFAVADAANINGPIEGICCTATVHGDFRGKLDKNQCIGVTRQRL